MPSPTRLSPSEETDIWWREKLKDLASRGRLTAEGRITVDPNYRSRHAHLSPEAINSMLIGKPPKLARLQLRESRRLRGRKSRTWHRAFDRSGPGE